MKKESTLEPQTGQPGGQQPLVRRWRLNIGYHRGTLVSREAVSEEHDSEKECREALAKYAEAYRRGGGHVWYANAIRPDGERIKLHEGTPYS